MVSVRVVEFLINVPRPLFLVLFSMCSFFSPHLFGAGESVLKFITIYNSFITQYCIHSDDVYGLVLKVKY